MEENKTRDNYEITGIIHRAIRIYPTLRFNQILFGLNIICSTNDSFYDESEQVLKRIKESEFYIEMNKTIDFNGVF